MNDRLTFKILDLLLSNVIDVDLLRTDLIKSGVQVQDMFDWEIFERFILLETDENHWVHCHGYKKLRNNHAELSVPERHLYTVLITDLTHSGIFLESEWRALAKTTVPNAETMTIFEILQRYLLFDLEPWALPDK